MGREGESALTAPGRRAWNRTRNRSALPALAAALCLSACLFETEAPPPSSLPYASELAHLGEAPNPILAAFGKSPGGSLIGLQFAFRSLDYAHDLDSNVDAFRAQAGTSPALAGAYFDFTARPERLRAFLAAAHARGCVPSVTLDPKRYGDPKIDDQKKFLARIAEGAFDTEFSAWAQVLRDFRFPVLLRFAHEMNGNWYPYGGGGDADGDGSPDGPEAFIRAWRYVHDRFAAEGAGNLIWIFCPNAEDFPDREWNRPFRYYPGDAYVDLIAVDVYEHHAKRVQSLAEALDPFLARLGSFIRELRRNGVTALPAFGLGEFGTNREDARAKGEWYAEALRYLAGEKRAQFHFLYNGQDGDQDFSLRNAEGPIAEAYAQGAFGSSLFVPADSIPIP